MLQSGLLQWLANHLIALGPGVLLAVCLLETAVFAGLVLPVGALIAFAAMLASRGVMDPESIIVAALAGAFVGDQVGFVVGRWFVARARPPGGRISTLWRRTLTATEMLVKRRGLIGISLARGVPFVRTLMPWFAGRSGVSWGRFLVLDILGLALWGTIYIGGGFAAGVGWRQLAGRFGEAAGLLALVGGVLILALSTRLFGLRLIRWRRDAPRT